MNPSKQKGTAAESAVTRYVREHGFGTAERRALAGSADLGDILLCPGAVVEVKAGAAAEGASDGQIARWLEETERERVNAGAAVALLVTKRKGVGHANAGRWTAHLWLRTLQRLGWTPLAWNTADIRAAEDIPVRLTLDDALRLLRAAGYGDELEVTS